jgi:hypothetical protein
LKSILRGPWTPALIALALALSSSASHAAALPLSFQGPWTIQLDSRYYLVDPGTLSVDAGVFALAAATTLKNCRRSSGLAQIVGPIALTYSEGLRSVYLNIGLTGYELAFGSNGPVLSLSSATGDVVCDGQITQPGSLFANDYE